MLKQYNDIKMEKNRLLQEQAQSQQTVTQIKAKLQQQEIKVEQKEKEVSTIFDLMNLFFFI